MFKKAIIPILSLCFGIPGIVWGQTTPSIKLTLDEAVTLALRDNRELKLKTQDLIKAQNKIAEANASLLPAVNASGAWSQTRGLYNKDLSMYTGQIGAQQLLYKGGQVINAIKLSEYNYAATQAARDQAKDAIIATTKKSFYAVLLAGEFSQINKRILDNTVLHLEILRQRYQKGLISSSELAAVESSLVAVEQEYKSSLNQLSAAQELLKNILAIDQQVAVELSGEFIYEPKQVAYETAFLQAIKNRPEIRQLDLQLEASRKSLAIAKAGSQPTIAASWDYYGRSHGLTGTSKNVNDYNVVAISVSWPVFDGWLTKAKVEQALVDLKQAQLLKEKGTRDVASELQSAYLRLQDAIALVPAAESEVQLYLTKFKEMQDKLKAGIASQLDEDDARLRYEVAKFSRSQALYEYALAQTLFEKAQGGL